MAETQTIYARVQPHVKEAADDYAATGGMTLANGGCPVRRGSFSVAIGCDGYTVTGMRVFSSLVA